jgi:probable F420-dependent oxidoreductase
MNNLKIGIPLSRMHPAQFAPMTKLAEELGFESVWLGEHLVMPVDIAGHLSGGTPATTRLPLFDTIGTLSYLAAVTDTIRLGTNIYLLGLRHPVVAARAFTTLDLLSEGRAVAGVGSGWLRTEWAALGIPWDQRGRRLDEALEIWQRLWTEQQIEYHGSCFDFDPVVFEPKPRQPRIPVVVAGESVAALRRAAKFGDGWMSRGSHTVDSLSAVLERLREAERLFGRQERLEVTVMAEWDQRWRAEDWVAIGVDRVILAPWKRPSQVEIGLRELAEAAELARRS